MRDTLNRRGIDALRIVSIWMALIALAVAAGAVNAVSLAEVAYRVLVALGAMGLSAFALWTALELGRPRDEIEEGKLVPVPVRVRR